MNEQRFIPAALLLSTSLAAQGLLPYTVATADTFGVTAVDGAKSAEQSLAAGTTITGNGTTIEAGLDLFFFFFAQYARTTAQATRNADGDPGLKWVQNGNLGAASAGFFGTTGSGGASAPGEQRLQMQIPVPAGTRGDVFIVWSGFRTLPGSVLTEVDVDGDGVADFTASPSLSLTSGSSRQARLPVVAGASGVQVDATQLVAIDAPGTGSYYLSLEVYFRPERPSSACTITPLGASCGVSLDGQVQLAATGADALDLRLQSTAPLPFGSFGVIAAGTQTAPTTVPGLVCPVWVQPVVVDIFFGSGSPEVAWQFPIGRAGAADFVLQAYVLNGTSIASNGLRIVCP